MMSDKRFSPEQLAGEGSQWLDFLKKIEMMALAIKEGVPIISSDANDLAEIARLAGEARKNILDMFAVMKRINFKLRQ